MRARAERWGQELRGGQELRVGARAKGRSKRKVDNIDIWRGRYTERARCGKQDRGLTAGPWEIQV